MNENISSKRYEQYVPLAQIFAARLVLFQQTVARKLGLSATDLKCFRLVQQLGPITAADLVEETGLTPASLSIVVEKLETHNYVTRVRDPQNRRRWLLSARADAVSRVDALYQTHAHVVRALLDGYDEREFTLVMQFLEQFSDALKASTMLLIEDTATSQQTGIAQPESQEKNEGEER